jgi:hypothetical protein
MGESSSTTILRSQAGPGSGQSAIVRMSSHAAGGSYPATAHHALREGKVVAHNVIAVLHGGQKRAFRCLTLGQLATIGRRTGVASIFEINFSGFIAWWLWRTIHLGKLPRLEKKVRVALDWTLDLCFAKDFGCFAPASLPNRPVVLYRPVAGRSAIRRGPWRLYHNNEARPSCTSL